MSLPPKFFIFSLVLLASLTTLMSQGLSSSQGNNLFQSPLYSRATPRSFSATPLSPTPTHTPIPDDTPPQTTLTLRGVAGQAPWYRSVVTGTLAAVDDWVGVGPIHYRVVGVSELVSGGELVNSHLERTLVLTLSNERKYEVEYYAQDFVGNVGVVQTATIGIDLTPPTVTHTLTGQTLPPNWHLTPTILNLIGQDNLSGIDFYEVNLDDSGWLTSTGNYTLTVTGHHTLTYRATDLAGNVSQTGSLTLALMHPPIVAEAEEFDLTLPRNGQSWPVLTHLSDFGGTGYITARPDRGVLYGESNLPSLAPELQYDLTLPFTGTYHLWLRGAGADAEGDEVYVALVEQGVAPTTPVTLSGVPPFTWGWSQQDLAGSPLTATVTMTGAHTLYLWPREDGVSLDRLFLTDNPKFEPVGVGPE